MRKPPIPSEENPAQHQERPGEPPANYPTDPRIEEELNAELLYEEERELVDQDLLCARRDPFVHPHRPP